MVRPPPLLRFVAQAALALAIGAACSPAPKLEPLPISTLPADAAPAITLESATVVAGRVQVTYRLEDRGTPITGTNAASVAPSWTLAMLDVEPVSGLPAWKSLILTGLQTIPSLLPAGPGSPGPPLLNQKQPGSETGGTTVESSSTPGTFTYTFENALPGGHPPGATLRVGVFLDGASGSALTNATLDFVPDGSPLQAWGSVSDARCNGCHGTLLAHGGKRTGVKLCLTCHTWLNADPDTADPAAMSLGADTSDPVTLNQRALTKRATYPNPLELGRFMHRVHRGRNLPTLYRSASCYTNSTKTGVTQLTSASLVLCNVTTVPPVFPPNGPPAVPPLPPADLPWTVPALPFRAGRNLIGPAGIKQSYLGEGGKELLIGKIASDYGNFPAVVTAAAGIGYPQDLRNCAACHDGDLTTGPVVTAISRRTCSGCHPDVWFGVVAVPADLDAFHAPHSGGPQANDSACRDCHVAKGAQSRWAPIAELHSPPAVSPRWKKPVFEIVDVQGLLPGSPSAPGPAYATIRFKASDAVGPISPLNAPTIAWDLDPAWPSPVPRKLTTFTVRIGGPNTDFVTEGGKETWINGSFTRTQSYSISSSTAATAIAPPWQVPCTPSLLTLTADAGGVFSCTFPNPFANLNRQPGRVDVQGYWTVGMEGRRASAQTQYPTPAPYTGTVAPNRPADWPWYGWILGYDGDPASATYDTFRWPGTGETVTEAADYVSVAVDLSTGAVATSPSAARRQVVSIERCNACHLRLGFHGGTRTDPNGCLFCHAADATDWNYRPRDLRPAPAGNGQVLLSDPLVFPATNTIPWSYWTRDGVEERSIQLKTMIHRAHTGEREGAASLEGILPFGIHTSASGFGGLDEVRYPNRLDNCEACHLPGTWRIEAVPSDALATIAHEEGSLRHLAPEDPLGALSAVATSPDGITWTARPIDATYFTAVAWSGTTFAAVGASVAASSPDGITWTVRTIAAGNWAAVTWSGTTFVAVGTDLVATSPDGITWTKRTIPAGAWVAVAGNGTTFVAVGIDATSTTGASYATSADGITWAKGAMTFGTYRGVAWNGAVFAAVGTNVVATSPNGSAWTAQAVPTSLYAGVAWNGTVFAMVGTHVAATSPDGITWTTRSIPAGNYTSVAWGGTSFLAMGPGAAATSPDGITWTARTLPAGKFQRAAWGGSQFAIVGLRPAAETSHSADEATGPVTAACLSCHTTASSHAAGKTVNGVEQCGSCHGESGAQSIRRLHAVP